MRQRKTFLLLGVTVAILIMSIGYAAIQQVNFAVTGNAIATPDQTNFKVAFTGTPTYSGKGTATLKITGDRTATISASGMTAKGDSFTAVFTVANTSTDITAYLSSSVTNVNTEYFQVTSTLDSTVLVPQTGTTNLNVTVELIKTPISVAQTDSVTVELIASPTALAGGGDTGSDSSGSYAPEDIFIWASDDSSDSGYGTIIGYTANVDNYTSLAIPTRCTKIEMTYLTNILEGTRSVMRRYTANIKEVELPSTIIEIGESAFSDYGFESLKKINIPSSVTTIGDWAFARCSALTSIDIPVSVTSIGEGAFEYCESLATITFGGTVAEWNKISLGEDWNNGVPATYVQCTDGKVYIYSYIGYYANLDDDAEPEGIIYADLAIGGSGQWNDSYSAYSYSAITGTKDYYISTESYDGAFGTKPVLTATGSGADRFYVMALEDITTDSYSTFYWYYEAAINEINDMVTYEDFGEGKSNSQAMVSEWESESYGSTNERDMWGVIQDKVTEGWFVPSNGEWGAFGNNLGITSSNYASFGLSLDYWSSSISETHYAYTVFMDAGCFRYDSNFQYQIHVRLSTTF